MPKVSTAVLFDLDGTLVQTREASWKLFEETNRQFGLGIDEREAFFRLFEDNFFRSLERVCTDAEKQAAAKEHFLNLLRTRYRPELIPGMADVIRSLAPHFTLAILSTNTMQTIRSLLTDAGIASCFAHVFAGDVEPDKSVSIRRFLSDRSYGFGRSCSPAYRETESAEQPSAETVVLVTDTIGDVKEARNCGIRAVGVAWGMHSEKQLLAAGAERVAMWPQELVSWLLSQRRNREREACGCSAGSACALPVDPAPAAQPADSRLQAAAEARRRYSVQSRTRIAVPADPERPLPSRIDPALLSAIRRIL